MVVDRLTSKGLFDQVGSENETGADRLTEHLIVQGHRRIALICGMPQLSTTVERVPGYRRTLRRHGLMADPTLIKTTSNGPSSFLPLLRELLEQRLPPTAIVSGSSLTTIGVMRAAGALHLAVPGDLALVAFDDFEWADAFRPRLTVVRQRMEEIGTHAVDLLQRRIFDPGLPVRTRRLSTDFIHRDSCGCE